MSTGGRWSGSRACSLLSWCAPCLLSSLLLCLRCVMLKYGSIWRFKGVFRGFLLLRVCLLGLGALRGLWGFCVRVKLGGLEACCVFASLLSSLLFSFLSFCSCFRLLSCLASCLACFPALCLVFLALWLGFLRWLGCWLSFPFGRLQIRKRDAFSASLPTVCC